jgi:hypothetical protein
VADVDPLFVEPGAGHGIDWANLPARIVAPIGSVRAPPTGRRLGLAGAYDYWHPLGLGSAVPAAPLRSGRLSRRKSRRGNPAPRLTRGGAGRGGTSRSGKQAAGGPRVSQVLRLKNDLSGDRTRGRIALGPEGRQRGQVRWAAGERSLRPLRGKGPRGTD